MTDRDDRITIMRIPVDRIRVLNPRERDGKRFQEIVDSIRNVGLKQPIKVTRLNGSGGETEYGLVYGQGRLEAFIALGQKEIPAIVADLSEEDSLLMSLIENVARRHRRPSELLREIGTLSERAATRTGRSRARSDSRRHMCMTSGAFSKAERNDFSPRLRRARCRST